MQDHTPASSVDNAIALQKYGVGQPVRRKEDDTLVRGKGKYTDDFTSPGQAYCWMVRSSHAHGIIKGMARPPPRRCRACSASGLAGISKPSATTPAPAACR